jgi:hypothetical protein
MLGRASNHRRHLPRKGVAARLLAVAAVASLAFAQFSASWHEATVQHVRCAEHGELTHVSPVSSLRRVSISRGNTVESSDVETVEAHDHCGFVFAVQGSAPAPVLRVAVRFAPPPVIAQQPADPAPRPGRTFVLASAPKTSPPSA